MCFVCVTCVFAGECVCIFAGVCVCIFTGVCVCVCAFSLVCVCVCIFTGVCVHFHWCVCVCAFSLVSVCVCICMYVFASTSVRTIHDFVDIRFDCHFSHLTLQHAMDDPALTKARYERGTIDTRDTATTRLHHMLGTVTYLLWTKFHQLNGFSVCSVQLCHGR